jgi:xylulokinase
MGEEPVLPRHFLPRHEPAGCLSYSWKRWVAGFAIWQCAERMLGNKLIGAHLLNIDFNIHTQAHIFRAVQEGIAFAFRYGLDIMRENGMNPTVIRAGKANLFLSDLFLDAFVNATHVPVELYTSDGSVGAAIGAGIGSGIYQSSKEAFSNSRPMRLVEPVENSPYEVHYQDWLAMLKKHMA